MALAYYDFLKARDLLRKGQNIYCLFTEIENEIYF